MLGFTLAHEFGHFLGLFHTSQTGDPPTTIVGNDPISDTPVCKDSEAASSLFDCPDFGNLMFPYVCDPDQAPSSIDCTEPEVTTGQGNVVRYNPGVTIP